MNFNHSWHQYTNTVDVERFAGLNICGLNRTEVFMETLPHYLGQKWLLLRRGAYIHKNSHGALENHKKLGKFSPANLSVFTVALCKTEISMECITTSSHM